MEREATAIFVGKQTGHACSPKHKSYGRTEVYDSSLWIVDQYRQNVLKSEVAEAILAEPECMGVKGLYAARTAYKDFGAQRSLVARNVGEENRFKGNTEIEEKLDPREMPVMAS
jgi:hypothetical protein